jgi:hypothetical protein
MVTKHRFYFATLPAHLNFQPMICNETWVEKQSFRIYWGLVFVAFSMCTSGCFAIRSEWQAKPEAPHDAIEEHESGYGRTYSQIIKTPAVDLEIGVASGPVYMQTPFLFWIIPIPMEQPDSEFRPLLAEVQLQPKSEGVRLDVARTFLILTNGVREPAYQLWPSGKTLAPNEPQVHSITNSTTFLFKFIPGEDKYPDRKMPFQLSIEGLSVSGQSVPVPPVSFKSGRHTRAGFQ